MNGGLATALRDGPGNCCMKSSFAELAHVGVLTMPPSNELFENQADLFSHPWSKAANAAAGSDIAHAAIGVL